MPADFLDSQTNQSGAGAASAGKIRGDNYWSGGRVIRSPYSPPVPGFRRTYYPDLTSHKHVGCPDAGWTDYCRWRRSQPPLHWVSYLSSKRYCLPSSCSHQEIKRSIRTQIAWRYGTTRKPRWCSSSGRHTPSWSHPWSACTSARISAAKAWNYLWQQSNRG